MDGGVGAVGCREQSAYVNARELVQPFKLVQLRLRVVEPLLALLEREQHEISRGLLLAVEVLIRRDGGGGAFRSLRSVVRASVTPWPARSRERGERQRSRVRRRLTCELSEACA